MVENSLASNVTLSSVGETIFQVNGGDTVASLAKPTLANKQTVELDNVGRLTQYLNMFMD